MSADKALRFYLLAVCFVAMVCAAITSGMFFYGLVKIATPELTLDTWSYSAHQSLENFRQSQFNPANRPKVRLFAPYAGQAQAIPLDPAGHETDPAPPAAHQPLSDEELELERQKSYLQVLSNHQRGALQDLIRLAIVLVVSVVLFYSHWRVARKQSASAG